MLRYIDGTTYKFEDLQYYIQVPALTKEIGKTYPGHQKWLDTTFTEGLWNGTRGYSFAVDFNNKILFPYGSSLDRVSTYKLAGCSLLKNTPEEKKICCLFIDPYYRQRGIASQLIRNSFNILQTDRPLITVSENNLPMLEPLLKKFQFELTSVQESVYRHGVKEYYYNQGR
jgi:ribosomal protein S18 acetylase RimI-like enzyme